VRADLEHALWHASQPGGSPRAWVAAAVERGEIPAPAVAHATLAKWAAAGLYSYGTALDLGWRVRQRHPRLCVGGCERPSGAEPL
jgi:hypothetical protein